jgi:hypothetical protein
MIYISVFSCCRFAKIKFEDHVFLVNRLQVSYAPQFEKFLDTKEKSEVGRNEVLDQIRCMVSPFSINYLHLIICCCDERM